VHPLLAILAVMLFIVNRATISELMCIFAGKFADNEKNDDYVVAGSGADATLGSTGAADSKGYSNGHQG
jgi:hypothetical protein